MKIFKINHNHPSILYLEKEGALSHFNEGDLIGGGAIVNLFFDSNFPVNDIDIFKQTTREEPTGKLDLYDFSVKGKVYEILNVSNEKLLNLIECKSGSVDFALDVLKSFDFNYLQIGLIKKNDEFLLIKTNDFLKFEHSNVIEISTFKSPLHSLIRYYKKTHEVPKKYKMDALSLKKLLLLCEKTSYINDITTKKAEKYLPPDIFKNLVIKKIKDKHYSKAFINTKTLSSKEKRFDLMPIIDILLSGSKGDIKKYQEIRKYHYLIKAFIVMGGSSLKNDFNLKNLKTYNSLLRTFPDFVHEVRFIDFKDLFQFLDKILKKSKEDPLVRDNLGSFLAFIANEKRYNPKSDVFSKNFLSEKDEVLTVALNHPFHQIEEITTSNRLKIEGLKMKHCVFGYKDKIKRNESRIFHVKNGHEKATLEINSSFAIIQLKGPCNTVPKYKTYELCLEFMQFLTKNAK